MTNVPSTSAAAPGLRFRRLPSVRMGHGWWLFAFFVAMPAILFVVTALNSPYASTIVCDQGRCVSERSDMLGVDRHEVVVDGSMEASVVQHGSGSDAYHQLEVGSMRVRTRRASGVVVANEINAWLAGPQTTTLTTKLAVWHEWLPLPFLGLFLLLGLFLGRKSEVRFDRQRDLVLVFRATMLGRMRETDAIPKADVVGVQVTDGDDTWGVALNVRGRGLVELLHGKSSGRPQKEKYRSQIARLIGLS